MDGFPYCVDDVRNCKANDYKCRKNYYWVSEECNGSSAKHQHVSAVGEVNVVTKMRETNAIIGGEGNGGVIYPTCHAGRDALVGICLFLSHLAHEKKTVSELRATYPAYFMGKNRIDLKPGCDVDAILEKIKATYAGKAEINTVDGVKLDFPETWVHLRKSNTEPIIRIYSEGPTQEAADAIGEEILALANSLM